MGCLGGAQWVQEQVLEKNPDLKIRVYAIWFSMIASDTPAAFPSAQKVMPDRRVVHFWDNPRDTGRWFKEKVPSNYAGPIMWDAFYLYGSQAEWKDQPPSMIRWGRTILQTRQELAEEILLLRSGR